MWKGLPVGWVRKWRPRAAVSGNFIPSRRKDERKLLGLCDKGGYASLSSLGEVQVFVKQAQSKQGICMRGYVYQCVFMARTPQWPLLA